MAFESLSERFQSVFKKMRKEDRLTEKNMEEALREIKVALLESDVNREGKGPRERGHPDRLPERAAHQNLP